MKKYISLLFLALFSITIYAQGTKNRLVVVDKAGNYKGFVIEQIDSVFFDNIIGNVSVDVAFNELDMENPDYPVPMVTFTPSEDCAMYRYDVLRKAAADELMDEYMIAHHFDIVKSAYNTEALQNVAADCPALEKGETYTIVAMAYDKYNTPGSYKKVDFTVPSGKASVKCVLDEAALNSITITITPDDKCAGYYVWLFAEGDAESTWSQWAANLGWKSEGDMVKYLGKDLNKGVQQLTWNNLIPGANYQLYVQACDKNNEFGDLVKFYIKTSQLGGEGIAEMTIEIGEYGSESQGRDKFYYQQVIFTPNDQCAAHRDLIMTESQFKGTHGGSEAKLMEYMKKEKNPSYPPFLDDPNWDKYGVNEVKQYIEHETKYVVFSMAKNAKGEWGPLSKATFTTPKKPKF